MRQNIADFMVKQKQPYEFKVLYAEARAREFVRECDARGLNYHVSVGGLDSITLYLFLRSIGIKAPGVSVSHLEDKSIQAVHKSLGIIRLPPHRDKAGKTWTKQRVIQEFGFPVLSKDKALQIEAIQNPSGKNAVTRHSILTEKYKGMRRYLAPKWLALFGGAENGYADAPFKVSERCCYYIKEAPLDLWAKQNNSAPFLGLMASEGGRREWVLKDRGCNYFGVKEARSCPFAIFSRQDLLQLARDLNVPVPEIYGKIVNDYGELKTTGAQRTGCDMCGFGIHLHERPHKFDLLYVQNPKAWQYWMYRCCTDETGTYGWGRVLDYIGVEWTQESLQVQLRLIDSGGT